MTCIVYDLNPVGGLLLWAVLLCSCRREVQHGFSQEQSSAEAAQGKGARQQP